MVALPLRVRELVVGLVMREAWIRLSTSLTAEALDMPVAVLERLPPMSKSALVASGCTPLMKRKVRKPKREMIKKLCSHRRNDICDGQTK